MQSSLLRKKNNHERPAATQQSTILNHNDEPYGNGNDTISTVNNIKNNGKRRATLDVHMYLSREGATKIS